jgi:hypothetical protein
MIEGVMKIRINIAFSFFLLLLVLINIRFALAEEKLNKKTIEDSVRTLGNELRSCGLNSMSNTILPRTSVAIGGLLADGETLLIKGMIVEVNKKDFCIPSAGGKVMPLDTNLMGRQYFLRFKGDVRAVFLWTEFDSVSSAFKFADLACTLSSSMPAFMFRQKLCVNQSGLGDYQIELSDGGGVLLFVRGGIVVDVRNKDIGIAKAIDEFILTRTQQRLRK